MTLKAPHGLDDTSHVSPLNSYYINDAIPKHKIDKLVLKYFIQEGFQNAALQFSREAGLVTDDKHDQQKQNQTALQLVADTSMDPVDFLEAIKRYAEIKAKQPEKSAESAENQDYVAGFSSIEKRKVIKYLILKGDITQAIHLINTHFPTVLDSNNLLLFKLLRLNLIEMIRNHKYDLGASSTENPDAEKQFLNEILLFVRENLISKVTHSHELLKELEMTMSLLCFNFDPTQPIDKMHDLPEELRQLFDLSLRTECYRVVNKAILDLKKSLDVQQYKGIQYTEFLPSMLRKLPPVPALDYEDVEMADPDSKLALAVQLEDLVVLADQKGKATEVLAVEEVIEPADLELQLEKIAILWITTEHRLYEKKIISGKRYGQGNFAL